MTDLLIPDSDARLVKDVDYNPYKRDGDPYKDVPVDQLPESELCPWNKGCRKCTARSKTKMREGLLWPDNRCERPCMRGHDVCDRHGAKGGAPLVSGRYSKYLPANWQDNVEEFLADPELLSLRDAIAILDQSIVELSSELPSIVHKMKTSAQVRLEDEAEEAARLEIVRRAEHLLAQYLELIRERRKLSEAERRRQEFLGKGMTPEQVVVFVQVIKMALREEIGDPQIIDSLDRRLRPLIG